MQRTPFNDIQVRNWMCEASGLPMDFPNLLGTMGSGPYEEDDFDEFLSDLGASVQYPTSVAEAVVVGRVDWTEDALTDLIADRAGQTLRVYSQEMLLAWIISHSDPFDEDADFLRRIAGDHPALQFLMDFGFDWPTTEVWGGGGAAPDGDWPKVGLLRRMGYRVGSTAGRSTADRRQILREVFRSKSLPQVKNPSHMREWGTAESVARLNKLANALSTFAKNQKRKDDPSWEAVSDWESDLGWLKTEYYDGRYDFEWPDTHVR